MASTRKTWLPVVPARLGGGARRRDVARVAVDVVRRRVRDRERARRRLRRPPRPPAAAPPPRRLASPPGCRRRGRSARPRAAGSDRAPGRPRAPPAGRYLAWLSEEECGRSRTTSASIRVGPSPRARPLHRRLRRGQRGEEVGAVDLRPVQPGIAADHLVDAAPGELLLDRDGDGVLVVLNAEDHRELLPAGPVERLVKVALGWSSPRRRRRRPPRRSPRAGRPERCRPPAGTGCRWGSTARRCGARGGRSGPASGARRSSGPRPGRGSRGGSRARSCPAAARRRGRGSTDRPSPSPARARRPTATCTASWPEAPMWKKLFPCLSRIIIFSSSRRVRSMVR